MHPNNAELVRVYTRRPGTRIEDRSPLAPGQNKFEVVVEAEAGSVKNNDNSDWTIEITAIDLSAGNSPNANGTFAQSKNGKFDGPDPTNPNALTRWPDFTHPFTVTVSNPTALAGHLLKYHAVMYGNSGQILSFAESDVFALLP